ncbi:hypothetical protein GOP47_0012957 [Adiantum capillus-veneris]|uniref:Uncharacterized protein n=1 Tax=Adiantum capillus-veneris TaxID=13818 RepID=A0A9D4ZHA7_ADICA|nr:hypothetical protein GOP47_0012957 [Adiantum capillus-veneris]
MAAAATHEKHSRIVPNSTHGRVGDHHDGHHKSATVEDGNSSIKVEESAQLSTRRSVSRLSRSSLDRLLSQCSSLHSLASLDLSFHGSSDSLIEADFHCSETLKRHGEQVLFCNDVHALYTASSTSSRSLRAGVGAWSKLENGHRSCIISREGPPVRAMAAMGDLLFSSHEDLKIRVWARSDKGRRVDEPLHQVAALPTPWDCVRRAMVPGAYVQVRRNQRKSLWIQHVNAISALAVSHRHGLLYSASWDRSVKVWRLPDFKCMESFKAHDYAINALALSYDGLALYTGSADSNIKAWARSEGPKAYMKHSLVSTLSAHRSAVNALAISHDGSLLYSGACDKAIVVWERGPSMGAHLAGALRGHRHAVLCLAMVGTTLCSGSTDKTIRLWHRIIGRLHTCLAVLEGHNAPIKSLSISSYELDESIPKPTLSSYQFTLYSASLDQDVKLWSIRLAATLCDVDYDSLQPALLQGGRYHQS